MHHPRLRFSIRAAAILIALLGVDLAAGLAAFRSYNRQRTTFARQEDFLENGILRNVMRGTATSREEVLKYAARLPTRPPNPNPVVPPLRDFDYVDILKPIAWAIPANLLLLGLLVARRAARAGTSRDGT